MFDIEWVKFNYKYKNDLSNIHFINIKWILNLPSEILQQLFCKRHLINKELQKIFNNIPFVFDNFIKNTNDIINQSIIVDKLTITNSILNKYYNKDIWIIVILG